MWGFQFSSVIWRGDRFCWRLCRQQKENQLLREDTCGNGGMKPRPKEAVLLSNRDRANCSSLLGCLTCWGCCARPPAQLAPISSWQQQALSRESRWTWSSKGTVPGAGASREWGQAQCHRWVTPLDCRAYATNTAAGQPLLNPAWSSLRQLCQQLSRHLLFTPANAGKSLVHIKS